MELELPEVRAKAHSLNPSKLFLFSPPKTGKTELLASLPNNLLIDLEGGSNYVANAAIFNVKEIARKEDISVLSVLKGIADKIKLENAKAGDYIYDYITLDTVTELEEVAWDLATNMYKNTPMGKTFKEATVRNLPNGAGYGYLREAFKIIYQEFNGLSRKCLLLAGHVKDKSITKEGKSLTARDIDLTGKLRNIVAADVDAIGFIYRIKDKPINMISFKTSEELVCGARPPHLSNKEFVISEKLETGELITYWEEIFKPE